MKVYVPGYFKPSLSKWIRDYSYDREDIGTKGRGFPAIPKLKRGRMTLVANKMGYERVSDIPNMKIPQFVDKLVVKYGERSALAMINPQRTFRKRLADGVKEKFELMYQAWRKKYLG